MDEAFTDTSKSGGAINIVRGLAGAALGGAAGYFLFGWALRQGFYVPLVPGALLGLGCGLLIRQRNMPLAIFCGIAALALGIFARWMHDASDASHDLGLFLSRLHRLAPLTLIMLGLGGFCGFWFALGSGAKAAR